jgi:hypothetical protein
MLSIVVAESVQNVWTTSIREFDTANKACPFCCLKVLIGIMSFILDTKLVQLVNDFRIKLP